MHVAVWEKANGPLPKGHGLIHLDGDRSNNALENLQLLTISEISLRSPKLNQFTSPNGSMKRKGDADILEWQRNLRREAYRVQNNNAMQ
jgi:hypothetical protein